MDLSEFGATMQSTTYFPMYYPTSDLNIGSNSFSSHLCNRNAEFGQERNYAVSLQPSTMDQYSVYDKAVLRQLIQNHEATFRNQVRELHRLYQRQRELIDDMRVNQIYTQHLLSDTIIHRSSQALPDISQTTSHSMSWLLGDIGSVSTQDLSRSNSNSRKSNILIDLNEPVQLETCHMEIMHDDQCPSGLLNYTTGPSGTNSSLAIDLNSLPDICFSETGLDEKLLKVKAEIDLNISVVIDEPSPPTIGLEGPVSPENNECSPPRGESEDIEIEIPPPLSDTLAARTLVMISTSQNSLVWFAEIVSSMGDDLESEMMKLENLSRVFRQEKEMGTLSVKSRKDTCKKACPKRRKHGKLSTSDDVKKGANTALKMPVLLSWGKIKKRRGDRRRKASKNVFLFVS